MQVSHVFTIERLKRNSDLDGIARLWDNAEQQGRIADRNAAGADEPHQPRIDVVRLKLSDDARAWERAATRAAGGR